MSESNGLPKGWAEGRIGDLVRLVNGMAFKPAQWSSTGLPIIRIQNLNDADADFNHCSERLPDKFRVQTGDLLFAWSGTPGTSFGAHVWRGGEAWLNQHIFNVRFDRTCLHPIFLRYAINRNLDSYIRQAHGGAGLAHITKDRFGNSVLAIAPLLEQHRIVAKIEEMFSHLDAAVASLQRAKANLKRYRASVLKSAVEGNLTEVWRKEHPQAEDGQMLLDRILRERREKWERDQLAKFKEKGKEPPKNWQSKYVEPAAPNASELAESPEGWVWATVEQVAHTATGGTPDRMNSDYFGGGIPWVKSGELQDGYVHETEETLTALGVEESNAKVFPKGTLCIALYGATVGKLGILEMDATTNQAVCGIFLPAKVRREYLFHYLTLIRPKLVEQGKGGAQSNISNGLVRITVFPLPPLAEQQQIVALVEERLSQIDAAEKTIDAELIRAKRLRQSILKRAFEGKLVPQDPSDEPASVLLERMQLDRTKASRDGKRPTRPRRARRSP